MNQPYIPDASLTLRLGLIYGSTREGRYCDTVARWAMSQINEAGDFVVDVIDPADPAWSSLNQRDAAEGIALLKQRIDQADAFVVVTPEYNHGYPAPLKALIDAVDSEWHAKPVAVVSYGGASGGLRAVEQLRQVFAELHAVTIRDSVSFASAWEKFDAAGELIAPYRARRSMKTLLARLHWWSLALRQARQLSPYALAVA